VKQKFKKSNTIIAQESWLVELSLCPRFKSLITRFQKRKFDYIQVGRISSIGDGIATIYGLDGVSW
jgi:hypothetical protein